MKQAVFYDPGQKRWKRIRAYSDALGIFVGVVIVVFLIDAVMRSENLPGVLSPVARKPYRALHEKERRHTRRVKYKPKKAPNAGQVGVTGDTPRAAFYVKWDSASFASLREYYPHIEWLFPEWVHVLTPDGKLQGVTYDNRFFDLVEGSKVHAPDEKVMPFLKSEKAQTQVFPLVNNYDPTRSMWMSNIGDFLANPAGRQNFRRQMSQLMSSDNYSGLMLDFEEIPLKSQPAFRQFVSEVAGDLHARGLKLFMSLPPTNEDYDYAFFGRQADGIVIMNYDQHYPDGDPGPVAGQSWFTANLQKVLHELPKDKVIIAVGNYGYEWITHEQKGKKTEHLPTQPVSVQDAWLRASESDEGIDFDQDSLNPHVSFVDTDTGYRHDVWFLDAVTALNEMRAANRLGIDKFALWRLGSEDRSIWNVWDAPSEQGASKKLIDVPPGEDVDHEPRGEAIWIAQRPQHGEREITMDPSSGLISKQVFKSLPQPYVVDHYGFQPKEVAISFDDGPDPKFTPLMLDVLKRENAKATFFLIGMQAEKFSSLTRRIYAEGHEIGNHTWSHPDISNVGNYFVDVELNLTERFFAAELGVKPVFFRPPYSIDQEPDTADEVRPIDVVQRRGYITVGDKIDPDDWRNDPPRTAEQITEDVIGQITNNPPSALCEGVPCGNIILLHDGGGDRTQTVLALPMIIRAVRARGYQIVPISTLLGKTRDQVMPHISNRERFGATIDLIAFLIFGAINSTIVLIFFMGDFLMTGRLLLVGTLAVFDRVREPRHGTKGPADFLPEVAVLIPAFNEEMVIERTVRSVLASTYPKVRAIVIDDGSKDGTADVVRESFPAEIASGKLLVLSKPNGGKAAAANFGLQHVTEEIFVAIDADTIVAPNAIEHLVPNFADPEVAAVAGNAKVGNRVNMWTRWQALEYITSQNFERRALDVISAVSVVPGAIGAWRTQAVHEAGDYPYDTVAEDADLTMSLLQRGHKVVYEDRALAYTEAPMNANGLMRQRFRWSFGILQAVWKHRSAFLRGGTLGWVALPNIVIFQILLPLVSPFIDIMFVFGAASYALDKYFHPETANAANFHKLVFFFTIFLIIDFITSAIAFALERKQARDSNDPWLLTQVWLQRFAYRQLFSLVLFKTLKRAFDGRPFAWDKLERTASVSQRSAAPAHSGS